MPKGSGAAGLALDADTDGATVGIGLGFGAHIGAWLTEWAIGSSCLTRWASLVPLLRLKLAFMVVVGSAS